jgi:hypothetical protein
LLFVPWGEGWGNRRFSRKIDGFGVCKLPGLTESRNFFSHVSIQTKIAPTIPMITHLFIIT